jgi:O-antigen/teichoic acid export membrane protein
MSVDHTPTSLPPGEVPGPGELDSLSPETVRRRAARGVMTIAFRGAALRLVALAGNVVLARQLSPHDFGLAAIGFTVMAFGGFLANGGFGASLIGQAEQPSREDLGSVLGFQIVVTMIVTATVAAVGLQLGPAGAVAAVIALTLPIDVLRIPAAILAERQLLYRPIVTADVTETATYYLWANGAAALGMGVWSIATGAVVRAIVGSITLVVMVPAGILPPRLRWSRLKRLLGFGARFQAVGSVNLLRDQGLNVAVAAIAGVTALGLWSVAFRLVQAPVLLFESLWRVSFPALARLLAAGEDARPLLERGLPLISTAAGFLVVAIGGSAPVLVPTLFGSQWTDAAAILPWAAVGIAISGPVSACTAGYLYAIGDAKTALRATLLHTFVWFATALPLLPAVGVEALGVGWLAACLADAAVFGPALRRSTGIPVLRVVTPPIAAAVLAIASGLLVAHNVSANVAGLAAALAVCEGVYGLAVWCVYREPLIDLARLLGRHLRPAGARA